MKCELCKIAQTKTDIRKFRDQNVKRLFRGIKNESCYI